MGNDRKRGEHKHAILNWRNGLFFLLGLAVATGLEVAFVFGNPKAAVKRAPNQRSQPAWGELEYTNFRLMVPEEVFAEVSASREMAQSLSQTPTLLMRLRVTPQSDLDALIRYWGQGYGGRAMRPFLESLVRVPEGEAVNITYFLPAIARMRLYTFPDIHKDQGSSLQDCFWTGINFFNEAPENSPITAEQVEAKLEVEYSQVVTNLAFGDLIVLRNNDRQIKHMCVHIADDVVFTKPSTVLRSPWVLMTMAEMKKVVASENPLQTVVYRKKQI